MSTRTADPIDRPWRVAGLVLVAATVPFLLAERTVAGGDTALLADPARSMARARTIWDPWRGLGTVGAERLEHLWPLGPYHWALDAVGAPDWLAQRLWTALVLLAASWGVLHLARTWRWRPVAGVAAAFVYGFSPAVLPGLLGVGRLLAYAGLPWLLSLAARSLRTDGWRHAAAFALVVATIGPVDPLSLLLVLVVPVGWIVYAFLFDPEITRAHATTTAAKMLCLSLAVNLWWIVARSVEVTNGLDDSRYRETAETVATASSAPEVVRGLGSWLLYDAGLTGGTLEPATSYSQRLLLLGATFALAALGLLGLGISRWRHRVFPVALVGIGIVLAVGAHDWDDTSPLGAIIRAVLDTGFGRFFRELPDAVPLVVLPLALGVGSLVGAAAEESRRRGPVGAAVVAVVAVAVLAPLWSASIVPDQLARPAEVPAHWQSLADHLDDGDDGSRILEVPGIDLAAYRWGTTVEPVTPSLVDRPFVARERRPQGSAASADLVTALDRRLQEGVLDPRALAPLARLLGVGEVVARNDLDPDRFDTVDPALVWALLRTAPGLGAPVTFGDGAMPPVAAFAVDDPQAAVRAVDAASAVLLSGDGTGIVDAAAAGLLDGRELIRYSAELTDDPDFVTTHLVDRRALVVTDSNRARAQRWDTVRDDRGFTETAEGGVLDDDPDDVRLPLFDDRPGTRTVVEQEGLQVRASTYGDPDRYEPTARPALATDGDRSTAWQVSSTDPVGERLEVRADDGIELEELTIRQLDGTRRITRIGLRFDDGDVVRADLDPRSASGAGQTIDVGRRSFETVDVEILGVSPGSGPVGIAELDLDGRRTTELVRMPQDLLDAGGYRTLRYPLALVQTREHTADPDRTDEERALARVVDLPAGRTYRLTGTAHVADDAPAAVRDRLTGSTIDTGCRDDLIRLDDEPVSVRVRGSVDGGTGALALTSCQDGVAITGGDHRFVAAPGAVSGLDIDQLVWCSAGGGQPCDETDGLALPAADPPPPVVAVTGSDDATVDVSVTGAEPGTPFWLVLGQSHDAGWELVTEDVVHESSQLVSGYANGFLVTPSTRDFEVTLRFVPQNRVDVAFLLSLVALLVVVGLLLLPARPVGPVPIALQEPLRRIRALSWEGALPSRRDAIVVGVGAGVGAGLVIDPLIGVAVGLLTGIASRREGWRWLFTLLPAGLVLLAGAMVVAEQYRDAPAHDLAWPGRVAGAHELVLTAVVLLVVDVAIDRRWAHRSEFR